MQNNYSPISKKKRRASNFKPSISLREFAEVEGLNHFALVAGIAASRGITPQYTRGITPYYHVTELRKWLANNEVPSCA